jgi:hypothetical protein
MGSSVSLRDNTVSVHKMVGIWVHDKGLCTFKEIDGMGAAGDVK